MAAAIDANAVRALFALPTPDGLYLEPYGSYFRSLGARCPVLLLSFAPKAAGTFFREAACRAVGGHLFRITQAQGGRDGVPYLPTFLACYLDPETPPVVSHIHMQALPANRNFIAMFGLKPVIMLRDVADMLASYWDMLDSDPVARADGLNCLIPRDFPDLSHDAKADFMLDVIAPWYASYFATWKDFADRSPGTVCVLRYADFVAAPADALHAALMHAGFVVSRVKCEQALAAVWDERANHRFNKGETGRGTRYFTPERRLRLARLLAHYPQLRTWHADLLGAEAA